MQEPTLDEVLDHLCHVESENRFLRVALVLAVIGCVLAVVAKFAA